MTRKSSEITLLIQASNGAPMLALARGEEVVFDSTKHTEFDGSRDYRAMLETGLAAIDATLAQVTLIGCDIGPGGLGVTRTAAAFANGLSYACGISLRAIPAFELVGAEVAREAAKPVAILRRAGRPFVHFGLYQNSVLSHYEHCKEELALEKLSKLDNPIIAGNLKHPDLPEDLINMASAETLLRCTLKAADMGTDARAYPIVEVLE